MHCKAGVVAARGIAKTLRLNALQRVMLQWTELHPYNASHIYKIAGRADAVGLRVAARDAFAFNQLGTVELTPDGRHYAIEPCDAPEIALVLAGDSPEEALAQCVAEELNRPFSRPRCQPMRFALVDSSPESHYLVTTYDHWTADSVASRHVLRHVLGNYLKCDAPANSKPLVSYSGTYRDAFSRELGFKRVAAAAVDTVRRGIRPSPVAQPSCTSAGDLSVDYRLFRAPTGTAERLRRYARSQGATVHDVLLAALARAMAQHLPRRTAQGQARDLALGTIVNTRPDATEDVTELLGMFLAYHVVRLRPDEAGTLEGAVRQTAAFTAGIKTRKSHLDSLVGMKLGSAIWPYLSGSARPHFMRKVMPLTAGISNVVLGDNWLDGQASDRILGYARAASTGPAVPLVLSPTTVGQQMNFGLSYRTTAFARAKIDGIQSMLLEQIASIGTVSEITFTHHPAVTRRTPDQCPRIVAARNPVAA